MTFSGWQALIHQGQMAGGALVISAIAGCTSQGPGAASAPADLILANARIYTVEAEQPWAEAVAIRDGKILAVGAAADVEMYKGAGTRIVDVAGRLVLPAFGDAHVHPVFGGMAYARCSLHEGRSIEDYQAIIAGCVADAPGDTVVYGVGWEDALFPPKGIPTKGLLDTISADRALIFESVGGHTFWVNSRTLELAGITRDTPDPPNGHIDRDPRTGEPVGSLQESAMGLVGHLVPVPTVSEMQESILYVGKLFNSLGITNWRDAGIDLSDEGQSRTLDAYLAVKNGGELTSHVSVAFTWANNRWSGERALEQIPVIVEASKRAEAGGIAAGVVKFYVDGVIPQRTAAMIEPYAGSDTQRGVLQIEPAILARAVSWLEAEGIQAYVHAIGDNATRVALDAFEVAREENGSLYRPIITHLNVIDPADISRFGQLGVIAQFQPTWASNYPYMDLTKEAIGPERSRFIYPSASLLDGGAVLAFGADWPVATADPLLGLQVAVTRINYDDPGSLPLLPEEGLTLEQAIRAHTLDAAYANGNEDVTGSIAPGKSADIIVLNTDIFSVPAGEIGASEVILTVFEGRAVYGSLDQFGALQ